MIITGHHHSVARPVSVVGVRTAKDRSCPSSVRIVGLLATPQTVFGDTSTTPGKTV